MVLNVRGPIKKKISTFAIVYLHMITKFGKQCGYGKMLCHVNNKPYNVKSNVS